VFFCARLFIWPRGPGRVSERGHQRRALVDARANYSIKEKPIKMGYSRLRRRGKKRMAFPLENKANGLLQRLISFLPSPISNLRQLYLAQLLFDHAARRVTLALALLAQREASPRLVAKRSKLSGRDAKTLSSSCGRFVSFWNANFSPWTGDWSAAHACRTLINAGKGEGGGKKSASEGWRKQSSNQRQSTKGSSFLVMLLSLPRHPHLLLHSRVPRNYLTK